MRILFILFAIQSSFIAKASPIPPIISKIVTTNTRIQIFSHMQEALFNIPDLPLNFQNEPQHILKNSNKTFLAIPGSGRIYEIVLQNDSLNLIRIDKTYFTGYNFQSVTFSISDTIYSFGGYGFWHFNGDLRVYNDQLGEWTIRPTNRYIPKGIVIDKSGSFYFIDTLLKSIYISGPKHDGLPIKNQYTDISSLYNKLFKLKIGTAEWEEMGLINDNWHTYFGYTNYGLLAKNENQHQILDIKNNRILNIRGNTLEKLTHTPRSSEYQDIRVSFCIGNTLYVGDLKNWIDSITIDVKDLVDSGIPLYVKNENSKSLFSKENILLIVLALVTLLIVINLIYRQIQKFKTNSFQSENLINDLNNNEPKNELLTEREKDLLGYIYHQSLNNKLTSVQDINEFIGVRKRSLEVQKRIRTDLILSINQKCQFLTSNPEHILSRIRSNTDKRMFEYFISTERLDDVKNILGL